MNDLGDFFAREFDETISRARQRLTLATVTTKTPFGRKALRLQKRLQTIRDNLRNDGGIAVTNFPSSRNGHLPRN
ncbi:MAG: hypothetical protein AB7G08_31990 [Hyphomicrobiaceae bacterium]|jgi:hypothetical protein